MPLKRKLRSLLMKMRIGIRKTLRAAKLNNLEDAE